MNLFGVLIGPSIIISGQVFAAKITFTLLKNIKKNPVLIDVLLLFLDNAFTYVIQGFMDLFGLFR